ncbi:MAG: HIT family protein [Rhodocyclaceae bacterium]|nr:HIT family protein [Rhodocyclaceae bacterium]
MFTPEPCPFCDIADDRVVGRLGTAFAIRDGYPVSPGHTLLIPRRHIGSLFELPGGDLLDLLTLLGRVKAELDREHHPDGYNIGVNDGAAAGQTVPHLHIHLIPRYHGDQPDPRGGVRWIFPEKADYWSGK